MPRFTASAPNPADMVGNMRRYRCSTVAACDAELRELHTRLTRTTHPTMLERIHADIDDILDRRTELARSEATATAKRIAHET